MYDSTVIFMAKKVKEFCVEHDCIKCPFFHHPILNGVRGEYVAPYRECRFYGSPNEWNIPEEDDNNGMD